MDHRTVDQATLIMAAKRVGEAKCASLFARELRFMWPGARVDENSPEIRRVGRRLRDLCWEYRIRPEALLNEMWYQAKRHKQAVTASIVLGPATRKAAKYVVRHRLSVEGGLCRRKQIAYTRIKKEFDDLKQEINFRQEKGVSYADAIGDIVKDRNSCPSHDVLYRTIANSGPHDLATKALPHAVWMERIMLAREAAWGIPLRSCAFLATFRIPVPGDCDGSGTLSLLTDVEFYWWLNVVEHHPECRMLDAIKMEMIIDALIEVNGDGDLVGAYLNWLTYEIRNIISTCSLKRPEGRLFNEYDILNPKVADYYNTAMEQQGSDKRIKIPGQSN